MTLNARGAVKIGVFATHPVQYQVPLWRALARSPGADAAVYYFSDHGVRESLDRDFGRPVAWDVDLLAGYRSSFLRRNTGVSTSRGVRVPDCDRLLLNERFDWVVLTSYAHEFERQLARLKKRHGYRIFLRAELTDERPIGRFRRLLTGPLRTAYLRWFYGRVDAFGVIGSAAAAHLARFSISAERCFPSPYCIDTDFFEAQVQGAQRTHCRTSLGFGAENTVLLFSGKLIPRKAPALLLEAAARLPAETMVVLLGDGELRPGLERRFRPLLGRRLLMPGFVNQSELAPYFAAADVFVLPSRFETWGLVANEAMQFGLPVVLSTGVGCRHDLAVGESARLVFREGDPHALRERIAWLMSHRDAATRMGVEGRQRVLGPFSAQTAYEGLARGLGLLPAA